MERIGILTSGGDSPGMNAGIRSLVRTGIYHGYQMMGIRAGFTGLLEGDIHHLDLASVADIIHRGGTILKTSRSQEFQTEEGQKKALDQLNKAKIHKLFVLGGDGSFHGAQALADKGVEVMALPCSIDNDLAYTDASIGFMTAVETITEAIGKIRDTSSSHERGHVIQVMGRKCGDLAIFAGMSGGAENILIPEVENSLKGILAKIHQGKKRGKRHHILLVTEGVYDPYQLAEEIYQGTGVETKVTILGYIQRGGSPTSFDRILASSLASRGLEYLIQGKTHHAMGFKGGEISCLPLEEALKEEKVFKEKLYQEIKMLSI